MTFKILAVDDNQSNLSVIEGKLLKHYHEVITASSGFEALEILKNQNVDIILLDIMMPEMDGIETCRKIRAMKKTQHTQIVMVTAISAKKERIRALQAGADDFITKPISTTELFARITSLGRMIRLLDELKTRSNITHNDIFSLTIDRDFDDSKILLIDDNPLSSSNITSALSSFTENIKVISTDSLIENISDIPDLIIINTQTTIDVLCIVTMIKADAKLKYSMLMLFAEEGEDREKIMQGLHIGVSDYFLYPIDSSELHARVKNQLKRKFYQDMLIDNLDNSVDLSGKDELTGIFNRRRFDLHMRRITEERFNSNKGCVAILDIDYFKSVNDRFGHQDGDFVLKEFCRILSSSLRATDVIARYGGEEFVIFLDRATIKNSKQIFDKIRKSVSDTEIFLPISLKKIRITISIGASDFTSNDQKIEDVLLRADKALYQAKNSGRNTVVCVA